jgi:hypothetical protein
MKLTHRLGYYFGGFSIGLIFLAFFLSGKRSSCHYGPEARVLKNISTKQLVYTKNALETITNASIDTLIISEILKFGSVNFSKLDRDLDSCKIYIIESTYNDKDIALTVENCNQIATLQTVDIR